MPSLSDPNPEPIRNFMTTTARGYPGDTFTVGSPGSTQGETADDQYVSGYLYCAQGAIIYGPVTLSSTFTVGVNDTGYDVKFFGATSGKYWLWDESADSMIVSGGSSFLGNITTGVDGTGVNVTFYGDTAGQFGQWEQAQDRFRVGTATDYSYLKDDELGFISAAGGLCYFKLTGGTGTVTVQESTAGETAELKAEAAGAGLWVETGGGGLTKVVGAQGAVVADVAATGVVTPANVAYVQADQTALADAVLELKAQVNALLARVRAHGLIAT